jgi:hypothetical protein
VALILAFSQTPAIVPHAGTPNAPAPPRSKLLSTFALRRPSVASAPLPSTHITHMLGPFAMLTSALSPTSVGAAAIPTCATSSAAGMVMLSTELPLPFVKVRLAPVSCSRMLKVTVTCPMVPPAHPRSLLGPFLTPGLRHGLILFSSRTFLLPSPRLRLPPNLLCKVSETFPR